jgi:hypothetical protein
MKTLIIYMWLAVALVAGFSGVAVALGIIGAIL